MGEAATGAARSLSIRTLRVALCLGFCLILLVGFSPGFLTRSDIPRKSDAVVLFAGPEFESRLDEAITLMREGYGRYLIIPAFGETYEATPDGALSRTSRESLLRDRIFSIRKAAFYSKHFEDTHVEELEAKRMMDERGLKSAIMVSSAYHLRRIGLIAGRVFTGRDYRASFNPPRFVSPFSPADWLVKERRRIIFSEYVKIGWFLVYAPFS